MPVTVTAKRALRSSKRKAEVNNRIRTQLEIAIRTAKRDKKATDVTNAVKLTDRAAKKNVIHRNKAARIKSILSSLLNTKKTSASKPRKTKSGKSA